MLSAPFGSYLRALVSNGCNIKRVWMSQRMNKRSASGSSPYNGRQTAFRASLWNTISRYFVNGHESTSKQVSWKHPWVLNKTLVFLTLEKDRIWLPSMHGVIKHQTWGITHFRVCCDYFPISDGVVWWHRLTLTTIEGLLLWLFFNNIRTNNISFFFLSIYHYIHLFFAKRDLPRGSCRTTENST